MLNYYFTVISVLLILLSSCNPTKQLAPDQLFLKKVKIKSDNRRIDKNDLSAIVKQQPNKKILGLFRFHLGVYNLFSENSRIKERIGEAPVVYDSTLTIKTLKQLNLYLKNKGYYENKTNYFLSKRKNKVKLKYMIESRVPYTIDEINYEIKNKELSDKLLVKNNRSLIKKNKPIDIDQLDDERERIEAIFKNEGYYYFNKEHIKFKVDSTIGNKNVRLTTVILDKENPNSSLADLKHKKYYINDVSVYLSKNFKDKNLENFDTTSYKNLTIHYDDKDLNYRPKMLKHAIRLNKNALYSLNNQTYTYKHLSELGLFKTTSIRFEDIGDNKLNSQIFITPRKTQSLSFEAIGTNSGGNLGLEGNFIYTNKNLFKGG